MTQFTQTILYTDTDGRARFREETLALTEGKPRLVSVIAAEGID